MQLFGSLVLSTITFNAAVWVPRNKRQERQIHTAFARLFKRLATMHRGPVAITWSLSRALYELGLPTDQAILRNARLRYLSQIIKMGQPHLRRLIQAAPQWLVILTADLEWLRRLCPEAGS